MKILHIVPSYKPAYIYGGPIESVAQLCEGLADAGNVVHVFTTTANGTTELDVIAGKEIDVNGVKVTYFPRITKDHTHISPALWKMIFKKGKEYDLVHIHSWWSVLVIIASRILISKKIVTVISPRGMLSNYILTASNGAIKRWIHSLIGKRTLSKMFFHATAPIEYEECRGIIPGWKGFLLPNLLNLPEIPVEKTVNNTFTLIFLSRVHPKKGIELLFLAISQLPIPVTLKIAGSGEESYIKELKEKASLLNISEKISWLGWKDREQKYTELMNADLFVLTSYNENFANVVIESLHVGTPVLISQEVGLAPFVVANDLGWVTSLDKTSIMENILLSEKDFAKRERVHKNGRKIIEENFSKKVLIQKYLDNYTTLNSEKH